LSLSPANFSIWSPVREPKGLADADGLLDDLRDGGVPVTAVAIVEDAVAADVNA
jgi:hypothetical protein